MTDVADKLREARALIEHGWTQGAYARTVAGRPIGYEEEKAACWCPLGAIFRASGPSIGMAAAMNASLEAYLDQSLVGWNDRKSRTQAEVIAAFDKAIELAEASQ